MAPRTLLLSVDGTLLVEIDSPARAHAAMRQGTEEGPLTVPDNAETTTDGRCFFRPDVHAALCELAADGVDLVWNTRRPPPERSRGGAGARSSGSPRSVLRR